MTGIKFCGMRSLRDIGYVNRLLPEYVGFVLAPKFWRCISHGTAAELKKALRPEIRAVGVFVDNPFEEVKSALETISPAFAKRPESRLSRRLKSPRRAISSERSVHPPTSSCSTLAPAAE